MEQEKYQRIMEIIKKVDECSATTRWHVILLMFKNSFFENEDSLENHEHWFEKEEIKTGTEYFNTITSAITAFSKYCLDQKSFEIDLFANEMDRIFKIKKFSYIYNSFLSMSQSLTSEEICFTKIYCGILSLGLKKESPIHKVLIGSLEDYFDEENIQHSKYAQRLKALKFENICVDELLMKRLVKLFNLLNLNESEEEIIEHLNYLENVENRKSSGSTNIEKTEAEENKHIDENKNAKNSNKNSEKEKLLNNAKEKDPNKELIAMEENKEKKDLINESGEQASDIHEKGEKELIDLVEEDKDKKDLINES